ncbi:MAG: double zinc ribbon domain-containing protein [Desulfohalobiaceae bacterium]
MFQSRCPGCGKECAGGANYCAHCGQPVQAGGGQGMQCPQCHVRLSSADRFCPGCGFRLGGGHGPVVNAAQWRRTEGDFAVLLDAGQMQKDLKGTLVVEQGTCALLFEDGRLVEQLAPGRHDVSSSQKGWRPLTGKGSNIRVVLADAGTAPLRVTTGGLRTSDPLFVNLECEIIIQIVDPDLFYLNLFKGRNSLGLKEMADWMSGEVRDALGEEMRQISAEELNSDQYIKERLAQTARRHLGKSLELYGLAIVQFRTLSVSHTRYDALQAQKEELVLQVWEQESELAGRKKLFDVQDEQQRQEIYEQTKKAEREEERLEVLSRLRKAITTGKIDEIRSKEEFDAFLEEIDTKRLLREEEKEELKRSLEEKKEDHQRSRQHMLDKLDIEQKLEVRRLELLGEQELDEELMKLRLQKERTQLEHDLAVDQEKQQAQRAQRLQEHSDNLQQELERAKTDQEKEDIRLQIKQKKWEFGQSVLERQRSEKLKQEREKMLLDLDRQERELNLKLQEQRQRHQEELERMQTMSGLSTEALIASSGSEQANILAELKKTELLGGWSEDKILAEAAKNSPEVAKAFQERYKAQSTDELKQLYERLIQDKDKFIEQYQEEQRQTRQDMKDITTESLRSSRPSSQVVYPPLGGQQGMQLQDHQPAESCTSCGAALKARAKFCHQCGQAR